MWKLLRWIRKTWIAWTLLLMVAATLVLTLWSIRRPDTSPQLWGRVISTDVAVIALFATLYFFTREHGRQMHRAGLTFAGEPLPSRRADVEEGRDVSDEAYALSEVAAGSDDWPPGDRDLLGPGAPGGTGSPPGPGGGGAGGGAVPPYAPAPPVLSPFAAALALGAIGAFIYFTNVIDETPRLTEKPFSGCPSAQLLAPSELRSNSALVVELSMPDAKGWTPQQKRNCTAVIRKAVLIVDGTPQTETVPITELSQVQHRWIAKAPQVGRHQIDIVSSGLNGLAGILTVRPSATPSPTPKTPPRGAQSRPRATKVAAHPWFINIRPECNPQLAALPSEPGKAETVAVTLKMNCPSLITPISFVNGGAPVKSFGPLQWNEATIYRWIYQSSGRPDRIDILVEDVNQLWPWPLNVRDPVSLSNIKDGTGALSGILVSLSGLLIGILQFLKGQPVRAS
jgi:hypothetical protein